LEFQPKNEDGSSFNAREFGKASIRIFSQKSKTVGATFMAPDKAGSMNRTPTLIVGAQFIEPVPSIPPGFAPALAELERGSNRATPKTIPTF
jgi:hypothetical protein